MGFDIKKVLGVAAPWIATAIGGPMGGQAVGIVSKVLGLKDGSTADDVTAALSAGQLTGEQMIALKQADEQFKAALTQAGFENTQKLEALAQEDRANARSREITLKDKTPALLAAAVTGGFFGLLTLVAFRTIPGQSHDIVIGMIGSLGTAWISIITYYFGSSAGSDKKTDLLAQAQPVIR